MPAPSPAQREAIAHALSAVADEVKRLA